MIVLEGKKLKLDNRDKSSFLAESLDTHINATFWPEYSSTDSRTLSRSIFNF